MTQLTSLQIMESSSKFPKLSLINSNNFTLLTNLLSLKITNSPSQRIDFIKVTNLTRLCNLTEINTWDDSHKIPAYISSRYGANYSVLDHFKELRVAKLKIFNDLNCRTIQLKYPHVRFIWAAEKVLDFHSVIDHYYEGDFIERNTYFETGIITTPTGDRYEGNFKDNMKDGIGIMFYRDGSRYEGEWKANKREGKGIIFRPDGSRQEVDRWMNDMRRGMVIDFFPDGSRYEAYYMNDKILGKGVMVYPDGSRYEDYWKNNIREGVRNYFFSESFRGGIGSKNNCLIEGKVVRSYLNGCHYEGNMKNGLMEGKGLMSYPDGSRYVGEWKNGRRIGKGIILYHTGALFKGDFTSGMLEAKGILSYIDDYGEYHELKALLNPRKGCRIYQ